MVKLLKSFHLLVLVVGIAVGEMGGIFREYKEDLNEYLTSEEVDRLVFGNDQTVISEKIRNLPDVNMSPPDTSKHHLPVPTLDPPLDSLHGGPLHKKHPQRQNFMSLMKKAAAQMLGHNRNPKRRPIRHHDHPVPQYRARPSTLVSSDPDPMEIAFKRIEIMASRSGLNMSSLPRRTQMQVVKKLIPKLPPRMATMMKNTMEHNSVKLYDYLPEPARDPLIEDDPDFIQHFMEDAKVTMDASDFSLLGDHGYEYTESTHEILPTSSILHADDVTHIITDHQPGTDYSIPTFSSANPSPSAQSLGLSVPASFENSQPSAGYGSSSSSNYATHQRNSPMIIETHTVDLKPIAAPLVSESHDIQYEASENIPSIISLHSPHPRTPTRSNKAIKVSGVKNVTPSSASSPVIRVSMPTKDEIKMPRPIRVSIITKDNNTNINPFVMNPDPVYDADVKEIKHSEEESKDVSGGTEVVKEEKEVSSTRTPSTTAPAGILISSTTTTPATTTTAAPATTSRSPISKKDNPLLAAASSHHQTEEEPLKFSDNLGLLDDEKYAEDDLLFKDDVDYDPYQDLSSSELIAELKKYNSDYANSLELDYPLAPHPLEYPDHPDHPDHSDTIVSTASSPTSPRPTMQQILEGQGRPRYPPHFRPGGPRPGHMRPRPRLPPQSQMRQRPHPARRPAVRPKQPLRINDVKVSQIPQTISKECDYFSEDICLAVQDYPIEAISEAVAQQPDTAKLLAKEPSEGASWVDGVGKGQEGRYNYKHYYGDKVQEGGNHKHRDFAGEGGFLCPSKVAYGRVKKGKSSSTGEWKYIVNYGDVTQTLRLEKCLYPGNSCSYVMPYYRTACTQVHNYHRLLAWDSEKGLHMDTFKIPTCCTCHVQGYYVPGQQHGVTPVRRRDLPPKLQYAPQRSRLRPPHHPLHRMHHHGPHHIHHHHPGGPGGQVHDRREQGLMAQQQSQQQQLVSSASTFKTQQTKFNDELHDLLAQYSSLRERIAKKKNERQNLLAALDGNPKENSKRESKGQEKKQAIGRFQRAMVFNMLKRIKKNNSTTVQKKLLHLLKEANSTAKPVMNKHVVEKATHFNGTAHKLKSTRAFNLQKIAEVLTNLSTGKGTRHGLVSVEKTGGTVEGQIRRSRAMLLKQLSENPEAMRRYLKRMRRRRGRGMLRDGAELDEIRFLRRALLKNRREGVSEAKLDASAADAKRRPGGEKRPDLKTSGKRRLALLKRLHQRKTAEREKRVRQRLRFGPNKSNKVNYSYHPIMAYFAGKHS